MTTKINSKSLLKSAQRIAAMADKIQPVKIDYSWLEPTQEEIDELMR